MESLRSEITDRLDREGVAYRRLVFTKPAPTVEALVQEQGVILEEMVKSILLREQAQPRRYVMACLIGDARVDPQAVRAALPSEQGWKRLTFASPDEVQSVTGATPGTVAPVCLPAGIPVVFDEAVATRQRVNLASGDPSFGLELSGADLILLVSPIFARIAKSG
jgi:prolyl-tRNA editing enzyme YbaK/EbsC (Cys-tRNA(Pro) deacylase)